jgi:hypothetical protein
MKNKKIVALIAIFLMAAAGAFAQTANDSHTVTITVAALAAIALNSTANISFQTTAPANAGDDPGPAAGSPATDTSKRLWYTACNLTATTRRITVGRDVAAPAGTTLQVDAAVEAGAGTNLGPLNISAAGTTDLVNAIPSIATGRTGTDGAGITYSFWVSTPGSLVVNEASPTVVTVTYTLTDDA